MAPAVYALHDEVSVAPALGVPRAVVYGRKLPALPWGCRGAARGAPARTAVWEWAAMSSPDRAAFQVDESVRAVALVENRPARIGAGVMTQLPAAGISESGHFAAC